MANYIFPKEEWELYDLDKLAFTWLSLFVMTVILLFYLTTWVVVFPTYGMHSLSKSSGFSALFSWQTEIIGKGSDTLGLLVFDVLLLESESEAWELSESMSNLAEFSLLLEVLRFISLISLDALATWARLAYTNLWFYTLICLFWLTKWVGRPQPVMIIALLDFKLLITLAASVATSLKINKFCSCFAYLITFLFFINVIVIGSL